MTTRIAISANTAWHLANFRLALAAALQEAGHELLAIASNGNDALQLEKQGIRFIGIPIHSRTRNPIYDFLTFLSYLRVLYRERPSVFLGYTVKPNVYGGLACRLLGIPSIHNITGLGEAFVANTWVTKVVRVLYRVALKRAAKVFFQNCEDLDLFLRYGLVSPDKSERVPGSGVNTEWFRPAKFTETSEGPGAFRFLLSGRLLWKKGVGEYVIAARKLLAEGRDAEFHLLGFTDPNTSDGIPGSVIRDWENEGVISYLGGTRDVRPFIARADCVVLPSYYREGVPRSLLEAASMEKPIIATDTIGCREVVDDGVTGLLCKPRDANDLALRMREMMDMPRRARVEMGIKARRKMIREFSESVVIERYVQAVNAILSDKR